MDAVDRRAAVLRAIVEEYVQTAQPVASQSIAQSRSLGVSSATVRNDMTQLEREGYIVQPHTSAGRIPTDQGYRYFVDHFTKAGALPATQRRAVAEFFASAHSALEDMLHETSLLLARLTRHAAVDRRPAVRHGPGAQRPARRPPARARAGDRRALQRLDREGSHLERRRLHDDQIARASPTFDGSLREQSLGSSPVAGAHRRPGGRRARAARRRGALPAGQPPAPSRSTSAARAASSASRTRSPPPSARRACSRCSSSRSSWCRSCATCSTRASPSASVPRTTSTSCATARSSSRPYSVDGQMAGTVGVLGPTRMDYQQALAAVAAVSQQLGRLLLG